MSIPSPKPKLMAIGDSLPQGCRQLTVKAQFCQQSWPARIAKAQGWDFAIPDHPRPILFDLEQEIRRLDVFLLSPANLAVLGLPGRIRENFSAWQANPGGSAFECFDNLAVAGGKVYDLYSQTSATADAEVRSIVDQGPDPVSRAGDLHNPVNGRFVLNPQQKDAYKNFTALDWVEKRTPETLLVHCGHNHGLFAFGFEARDQSNVTQGTFEGKDFFEQWDVVAGRLAALSTDVKNILVVLLPKVGAVAELQPASAQRTNGYATAYVPRIIPTSRQLPGSRVRDVDGLIRSANEKIKAIILAAADKAGTVGRLKFLDAYAALDERDYKNSLNPTKRLIVVPGHIVDNDFLHGDSQWSTPDPLAAGGYQSLDGMHASGVGYADLASKAMTMLEFAHDRDDLLATAYAEDTVISNYPGQMDALLDLIDSARKLIRLDQFVPDASEVITDQTHWATLLPLLSRSFIR